MRELNIGGSKVPAIGLGTWHMGDSASTRADEIKALQEGIHAGARVIDTAEMYGNGRSESLVAKPLRIYNEMIYSSSTKFYPQTPLLPEWNTVWIPA